MSSLLFLNGSTRWTPAVRGWISPGDREGQDGNVKRSQGGADTALNDLIYF